MSDRIRLSSVASLYLKNVKSQLKLHGQHNYVPMRIAFGRSIQTGKDPVFEEKDPEILQKAKTEAGGEQPPLSTFEQGQGLFFRAILTQRHQKHLDHEAYVDLLIRHVEHGLWVMNRETEKLRGYDYLATIVNNARQHLPGAAAARPFSESVSDAVSPLLNIRIGTQKGTNKPIYYAINAANNPHFGIMGGSGSGKTYFLKHLLQQIRQQSGFDTHFLMFDYAKGDIANDRAFVNETRATVIDVKRQPLPLNIFADAAGSAERRAKAEKIVGVFKNVEANFGKVQEDGLYNAILNAYENTTPFPDFEVVRETYQQFTRKPDSLTSILRPLVEQQYFASTNQPIWSNWADRTTIVDLHEIERRDLVCFLILDKIFEELKRLGDAPTDEKTGARKIRTVVVIDEAHNFLAVPKRAKVLETMIREIRSMGGMVILASQSPDDYNTSNFDFLELLEFPIVLSCKPQSHRFLEQKFSITPAESKDLLRDVGKLNRGEGYLILEKRVILGELCK